MNKVARTAVLLFLVSTAGLVAGGSVWAFALNKKLTKGTIQPSDDLDDAVRWSNQPGSLVADDKRGLGGGVEYAVSDDFCEVLLPRFLDEPRPKCAELQAAIRQAFDAWSADHKLLTFTNVSGKITPELPPRATRATRPGYGAEVDIFAKTPPGFPRSGPFGAETTIHYLPSDPVATTGRPVPGNTLTSADIIVNPTKCFYMDPVVARSTCNHFPSLMLHEVGRSLGLGQPDVNPKRNWDNDSRPHNAIVIDCDDPRRGLRLSRRFDPNAAMISGKGLAQRVQPGLTHDDIGARDFLYPRCGDG